jgi:coenzyme F420-0:L-glutamate ligase/coenzyme F420-1:gamma-L-glutamate ligase
MKSDCSGFYEVVRRRRSIRRFEPRPVEHETLRRILEAATMAPSAHNSQPWRFAVLTDARIRQRLGEAMGEAFRSDLARDGKSSEVIARAVNRSRERLEQAPVAVVISLSMVDADRYSDDRRRQAEHVMAVQGSALAAENLLLAATAEGLGGCWLCSPLFCPRVVAEVLSLPGDWEPLGMLLLGYPASRGGSLERMPLDKVTLWR